MPKPYDYDLRKRAINLINNNKKRRFVSKTLQISIATIDRWIAIYKRTGDVQPTKEVVTGRKSSIKDFNSFTEFVQSNKLLSLSEMTHKWQDKISFMTIYRNIKKLGYSYKKNSGYIKSETKKLEESSKKK